MSKRTNQFKLTLTDEQNRMLNERAKTTGFSKSEYLRALIEGVKPCELPSPDLQNVLKELRSIGNTLGELTFRVKANGFIDDKKFSEASQRHWEIMLSLQKMFLPERIYGNHKNMED